MTARNPNRASSVHLGSDGYWHGRVTVGFTDSGALDRQHVMARSKGTVVAKVRKLERDRDQGQVQRIGQRWTLSGWLEHWLENIAAPDLRPSSLAAYRTAVHKHLMPGLGKHRLDRLEPEHLERLYREMIGNGSKPGTAHQVHRTVRTALGEAQRRGRVGRSVASLAKPPRIELQEVEPYSMDEVRAILVAARDGENEARWAVALALGLRQGEALGLRWSDVDLDSGVLWVRSAQPRPVYVHGCGGSCGKFPGWCPHRVQVNGGLGDTKSRAGRRRIALPGPLVQMLREHRIRQEQDRERARQLWQESGRVFTSPTGKALNSNSDYRRWKLLLKEAGVRDGRLHDARHTAATVLLVLGVPERTVMGVMGVMGWSSTAMAARYQHVTDPIRRAVADQVGGLLWAIPGPAMTATETRSLKLGR